MAKETSDQLEAIKKLLETISVQLDAQQVSEQLDHLRQHVRHSSTQSITLLTTYIIVIASFGVFAFAVAPVIEPIFLILLVLAFYLVFKEVRRTQNLNDETAEFEMGVQSLKARLDQLKSEWGLVDVKKIVDVKKK